MLAVASLLLGVAACKKDPKLPAAGSADADKFLFDRGTEALEQKNWLEAREYFQRLVDTYPQSQLPRRTPSSASATPTSARSGSTRSSSASTSSGSSCGSSR